MKEIPRHGGGITPLMAAAANGHLKIVKFYIENTNADWTMTNDDGLTAADLAAKFGHKEVADYLTAHAEKKFDEAKKKYGL